MPKKLENLRITKVDFVNAGANQRANIAIFKHAPKGENKVGKTKDEGVEKLIQLVAKRFGLKEQPGNTMPVAKSEGALTFGDTLNGMNCEQVCNEIWDTVDALRRSLFSIIQDENVKDKPAMMKQSVAEFKDAVDQFADSWGNMQSAKVKKYLRSTEPSASEIEIVKRRYASFIEKADSKADNGGLPPSGPEGKTKTKADKAGAKKKTEDDDEMKIDKSKMTSEERAFLDDIEKRYAVTEPKEEPEKPVKKSADEVLKKFAPELADIIGNIEKRAQAQEDAELVEVAKKYEILGKKAEDLAPILKKVKAASPEAYDQIIGTLDKTLDVVNKSKMFTEVGKNGSGSTGDNEARINKFAEEIRKSRPELSTYEARDLAYQQHPELIDE